MAMDSYAWVNCEIVHLARVLKGELWRGVLRALRALAFVTHSAISGVAMLCAMSKVTVKKLDAEL